MPSEDGQRKDGLGRSCCCCFFWCKRKQRRQREKEVRMMKSESHGRCDAVGFRLHKVHISVSLMVRKAKRVTSSIRSRRGVTSKEPLAIGPSLRRGRAAPLVDGEISHTHSCQSIHKWGDGSGRPHPRSSQGTVAARCQLERETSSRNSPCKYIHITTSPASLSGRLLVS